MFVGEVKICMQIYTHTKMSVNFSNFSIHIYDTYIEYLTNY